MVNFRPRPPYYRERTVVSIEQKARWAREPVWWTWRGEKSLSLAGIRPLDRPGRNLVAIPITLTCIFSGTRKTGRRGGGVGWGGSLSTAPSRFESFLLSFVNFRVGGDSVVCCKVDENGFRMRRVLKSVDNFGWE